MVTFKTYDSGNNHSICNMFDKEIVVYETLTQIDLEQGEHKFVVMSPLYFSQSYAGIYDFNTVMNIIDGYRPLGIIVNCASMHARIIVRFIEYLQLRNYKITIHRTSFKIDTISSRIIILRSRLHGFHRKHTKTNRSLA